MRKGPLFIHVILFLMPVCAFSQGWQRTFGNASGPDFFYALTKTANGGAISIGSTPETGNTSTDVFLVRTDESGQAFFTKNYGNPDEKESGQVVFELSDGSILIGGSFENAADTATFLLKTDGFGNLIWRKNTGLPNSKIWSCCQTTDGNFVFCGEQEIGNDRKFFLIKTDSDGEIIWSKNWGTAPLNILRGVQPTANGGVVATGYSVNGDGDYDGFLAKIDQNGLVLWQKNYGTNLNEYAFGLAQIASSGGWMVAGYESDGADENGWVLLTDENGIEIDQVFLDKNGLEQFRSVVQDADGNFLFLGQSRDNVNDDRDLFLVKTDEAANEIFSKKYGAAAGDAGYAVAADSTGYFLAGHIGLQAVLIKTGISGGVFSNVIKGRATFDADENCQIDATPEPLAGWLVKMESASGDYFTATDSAGFYEFQVDTGSFLIKIVEKSVYWASCTGPLIVNLAGVGDTSELDFLVKKGVHCPLLQVDICTNKLKRCFDNVYAVRLCNIGTEVAADAKVLVLLDPFLTPGASSLPYSAAGDSLLFEIGDVQPLDCQSFTFHVVVDCDSTVLGQAHCTTVIALPDSSCLPAPGWDGSNLEVGGQCDGDSLKLTIKNTGSGAMAVPSDYVIIEDVVLLQGNPTNQLLPGAQQDFTIGNLDGSTFTLKTDQTPGHPGGNLHPTISVEGCGAWPFPTGFVLQFPTDDGDPTVDTDCRENVGSFDPNDKQGFPTGISAAHFIEPGQEIEYLLRFQNTGTDTAVRVEIRDTLSNWLNPASIQPGASSHNYVLALDGPGIVRFIFDDINLPDSAANGDKSNGWVKFRIAQKTGIPLGTVVENRGAIFFDFNPPVITNTVFHTIGQGIPNSVAELFSTKTESLLKISPNPTTDFAWLEWPEIAARGPFFIRLLDENGRVLFTKKSFEKRQRFSRGNLPAGIYFVEIMDGQQVLASSRLVLK